MSTMSTYTAPVNLVGSIWGMARKAEQDKAKKVGISARVDPQLAERFEALAAADERTVSYLVEKAMLEYLQRHDDAAKPKKLSR